MLIFSVNIICKMEVKYKSLSIFDFQARFPDEDSCLKELADLNPDYALEKNDYIWFVNHNAKR